jgi:hypothetical protein
MLPSSELYPQYGDNMLLRNINNHLPENMRFRWKIHFTFWELRPEYWKRIFIWTTDNLVPVYRFRWKIRLPSSKLNTQLWRQYVYSNIVNHLREDAIFRWKIQLPSSKLKDEHWGSILISNTGNFLPVCQSLSHVTTDGQSVSSSWCRSPLGAHDQILITIWHSLFCQCKAPPLTRGRVRHLS